MNELFNTLDFFFLGLPLKEDLIQLISLSGILEFNVLIHGSDFLRSCLASLLVESKIVICKLAF